MRRQVRAAFFRSSTWRLALLYMVIFLLSVSILLAYIYWSTVGYMSRQADATIDTEILGLAERYREHGLEGLSQTMQQRVARNPDGKSLYLFAAPDYRSLAGNMSWWPDEIPDSDGWITFPLWQDEGGDHPRRPRHYGRARVFVLRGGLHLLVGRDIKELEEVRSLLANAIGWGVALTAGLAALGGLAMSRSTKARLDSINQTSREIMRGDLSRRVPTRGSGDDYDQLAENLNAMLDRIQELMAGVREVSDNVAHDLKTPLARLRNRLETLQRMPAQMDDSPTALRDEVESVAAGALAEADRLLSMFDAVLRIARIETGAGRARRQSLDLARVLHDVFELYEPVAQDKGVTLSLDAPSTIALQGDPDLLFQAVSNVIDNAIKFSSKGNAVRIHSQRLSSASGQEAEIVVADGGPGIPREERERVFRRFHRLENSRSTPGNGLGLSLVHAVMELHHGEVTLQANQPSGLRVVIKLPL